MSTSTLSTEAPELGTFLRRHRARVAPTEVGTGRRRTPGLRREEVAARAHVSVTWYTFLEQGRGGPPSSAVLERLADALELDRSQREILFLLAQKRSAPIEQAPHPVVSPQLQSVLDAIPHCPAFVKTISWDIVAWNRATSLVLSDYGPLPLRERNVLRRLFPPGDQVLSSNALDFAGFALAAFRGDLARLPTSADAHRLVAELAATNADFRRLWAQTHLLSQWVGRKVIDHPEIGELALDYSSFAVDGSSGMSLVVFTPSTPGQAAAVAELIDRKRPCGHHVQVG